jgi:hypothetical protein
VPVGTNAGGGGSGRGVVRISATTRQITGTLSPDARRSFDALIIHATLWPSLVASRCGRFRFTSMVAVMATAACGRIIYWLVARP